MHRHWPYLLAILPLMLFPLRGQADVTLTAQGVYLPPTAVADFHSLEARDELRTVDMKASKIVFVPVIEDAVIWYAVSCDDRTYIEDRRRGTGFLAFVPAEREWMPVAQTKCKYEVRISDTALQQTGVQRGSFEMADGQIAAATANKREATHR